jgi:hypothetical protein
LQGVESTADPVARARRVVQTGDMRAITLIKQISQSTFDEAVRENIEEFGMDRQEAIDEAIKQFEAQAGRAALGGVNTGAAGAGEAK